MSYILTLVSSIENVPLSNSHLETAANYLHGQKIRQTCEVVWLHPGKAADLGIDKEPDIRQMHRLRQTMQVDKIDALVTKVENRRKRLLIADMDSTIVVGETLDELSDMAGVKKQVAAITQQAMDGEIDFAIALRRRVALLEGLKQDAMEKTLSEIKLNKGADVLAKTMRHYKAKRVLVTGGFTFFAGPIANKAGFSDFHANELELIEGIMTGRVKEPILDRNSKLETLYSYCKEMKISLGECLAIGDGANDLPMLGAAGLGIGYKPKRIVAETIPNLIVHGDLTCALYAQGYTEQHIRDAMAESPD